MSGIFESVDRTPVEYLPTGDKALVIAWYTGPEGHPYAVLCLEDGTAVGAKVDSFRFEYRYSNHDQSWVDVSRIVENEGELDADTDQEDADDGGEAVPGHVPDADRAGPGDPLGQP